MTDAVEGEWRGIRERILRRDEYRCVECGRSCNSSEADTRRDIGLLRFMAGRAVRNAQLPPTEASTAWNHKAAQIYKMARLTTTVGCFRGALVGYFTGPKRPVRRSFSTWLLEFVFADRGVRQQEVMCCDSCQQLLIDRQGPLAFVNTVLAE